MDEETPTRTGFGTMAAGSVWSSLKGGVSGSASKPPDHIPDTWEEKGDVLHDAGKMNEALECYTRGLEEDPKHIELWMKKADIFLDQKRFRSGLFCVDRALHLDASRHDLWLMRGILLCRAGDQDGALTTINYALSLKGDTPTAWTTKCACLMEKGRYDEARTCLEYASGMEKGIDDIEALGREIDQREEEAHTCPKCGVKAKKRGQCEKCLVELTVQDAESNVERARAAGRPLPEADEMIAEARSFSEKKFHSQALKVIKPLKDIIGDDWVDGSSIKAIVEEVEEIAETLDADDMRGTVSIRQRTERVREAIEEGRLVDALMTAQQTLELTRKIAKKYSDLLLKEPERKKKKAEATGPVCPGCGEEVEDDWVKCPVCKAKIKDAPSKGPPVEVPEGPAPAAAEGELLCPNCKEEIEAFWDKCLFCGNDLKGGG